MGGDWKFIVGAISVLLFGFNSFSNYQRTKPMAREEGLYWAYTISECIQALSHYVIVLRNSNYVSALYKKYSI